MRLLAVGAVMFLCVVTTSAQQPDLSPRALETALAAKPQGADAEQLATRIRALFGGADPLARGAAPKVDDLTVAWALETAPPAAQGQTPPRPPRVASDNGAFSFPMIRVGTTNVYAVVTTLSFGTAFTWHYEVGDRRLGGGQLEVYTTPSEAREQPGVPKGTVKQMPAWDSKIFAGTKRDWWVYVPAQYRPENPAAVMVFQDGAGPKDYVPTVFNNLIARGDMPITVAVFVDPGKFSDGRSNRSF